MFSKVNQSHNACTLIVAFAIAFALMALTSFATAQELQNPPEILELEDGFELPLGEELEIDIDSLEVIVLNPDQILVRTDWIKWREVEIRNVELLVHRSGEVIGTGVVTWGGIDWTVSFKIDSSGHLTDVSAKGLVDESVSISAPFTTTLQLTGDIALLLDRNAEQFEGKFSGVVNLKTRIRIGNFRRNIDEAWPVQTDVIAREEEVLIQAQLPVPDVEWCTIETKVPVIQTCTKTITVWGRRIRIRYPCLVWEVRKESVPCGVVMNPQVVRVRVDVERLEEQIDEIVVLIREATQKAEQAGLFASPAGQVELPKFALDQNFPNPFNPETWIPYKLGEGASVTIRVYDTTGRLIRTLPLGHQESGNYASRRQAAYWDGQNEQGERVASGVYIYQIHAGNFSAMRKMLILK